MVLQSFRSSYSSKNPNGSIQYVIAIYISFLLEYEELANHVIRNNDHNLRNQLHQKAAPVQTVDEYKQHQFFHTEGQQASAEETSQLCPEALGRISRSIEDPSLVRNKLEQHADNPVHNIGKERSPAKALREKNKERQIQKDRQAAEKEIQEYFLVFTVPGL